MSEPDLQDIFVHDIVSGATVRASIDSSGAEAMGGNSLYPAISGDGRYVAFRSHATNLVPNDTNGWPDIFVHDIQTGTITLVDVNSSGVQAQLGSSQFPSISNDGRFVSFQSAATNLVTGDTNGVDDIFVHDTNVSGFTSSCGPGSAGVIACPCSNAPSGPGRGCNNSSSTGGASLAASGTAYLATDSLVFTTSNEKPTATSILLQGTTLVSSGAAYGQGVRCAGGSLVRLFTKNTVAGSVTVPNFAGGDPTVSARSAAKGDVISAGQSRWYLVYYRDPGVLGGCPSASTFNATQTGRIDWSM